MNEKVKVKFMRYKNVVLMEVLEMPKKYRGKDTLIISKRGTIKSLCVPEIRNNLLCLRGNITKYDNDCSTYSYSTTTEALKAIKNFSSLIHELNRRDAEPVVECGECGECGEFEITIAE